MSGSITTPIKNFRPQRTGNRLTSVGNMGLLKTGSDYFTSSDSINIIAYLPFVTNSDWSIYDEYDYNGNTEALYIDIVHMDKINKVASNLRESRNHDTSNPCAMCGNTVHTFD